MAILLLLICAVMAVRASRLLNAALWLAGVSAMAAVQLFSMGAYRIAAIELSVGSGLVTVLMVFAITLTGDEVTDRQRLIPLPLIWALAALPVGLFGVLILTGRGLLSPEATLTDHPAPRDLDVLLQALLIFAGGLTVLGLLHEKSAVTNPEEAHIEERELA